MTGENKEIFGILADAEPVLEVFQSVKDKQERELLVMIVSAYLDGYLAGATYDKQSERR